MAIAFFLLGAFLLFQATQLSMRSLDGGPGAGVLPAALGILLMVFSARLIPGDWRDREPLGDVRRAGIMVLVLAVYAATLERLGFVLTTAALMILLLATFNSRRRLPLAALGVVGTLASYALFAGVLRVQLPADPWGVWR